MKLISILLIMLSINVFLFLGQVSVDNLSAEVGESGSQFFNYESSFMNSFGDASNYTINTATNLDLPDSDTTVSTNDGNLFTDAIASAKNWFTKTKVGQGVSYFTGIVNAVPNFLKAIGLPKEIVFALGFFWYALTIFLVSAMILGRTL